jgi:hypothetical protein
MKITYTTAAQCLLFLAACLPAATQTGVNPSHVSDASSTQISANTKEAQVNTLQQQLKSYEQQLRAKAEQVENAWQQAIGAGGDFAGPYIAEYLQQQKELDQLRTNVTPQSERTRMLIANLTMPAPPSGTPNPTKKPARPARAVVTASNSHEIR